MKKIRVNGVVLDIMSMPEVQEILAEFEGRISSIENSMPLESDDIKEQLRELSEQVNLMKRPYLTPKQNDTINQIKAGYLHLQGKVNELFAYKNKRKYLYK